MLDFPFTIHNLGEAYRSGEITIEAVIDEALRRAKNPNHPHVWIAVLERNQILAYARASHPDLPLYGIPFAIKDNIDLAGVPTTCGCPDFAFIPAESAYVVELLMSAGAIPIGKTNLDQFATGLNGTRSPYGSPHSVFHPNYVSGGSSSGSAVAVASGMVAFALGTDTAGSGRVPAGFNNIVGLKPSLGSISNRGVFPACKSLDSVSIFANSCHDAERVLKIAAAWDPEEAYSRQTRQVSLPSALRVGVPKGEFLEFFGDREAENLFVSAIKAVESLGVVKVEVDYQPFLQAAQLLYAGPWTAERRHALGKFFEERPEALHPVVRRIIGLADQFNAVDTFAGFYELKKLAALAQREWEKMDVLLLPTSGTIYKIAGLLLDPIQLNTNLGYYTNFVNLFDLAAIAVPAGFRPNGLPFGVTLIGPTFSDGALLELGDRLHRLLVKTVGASDVLLNSQPIVSPCSSKIALAVVGAHLSGQPLHYQLTSRKAHLLKTTRTAPHYRLYALADTTPAKPGLCRVEENFPHGIEVEVWEMDEAAFGSFVAAIPAPLGIGTLELNDGSRVSGFICEPFALENAVDITEFGGWRAYLAR